MLKSLPLFVFGIALVIVSIVIIKKFLSVFKDGTKTIATVVDVISYPNKRNIRYYVLQYKVDGITKQVVHNVGSEWITRGDIGKERIIKYSNSDPSKIVLYRDYSLYIMAIVMGVVGIWLVIEGITLILS